MESLAYPLLAYYAAVMAVLCIYGLHRYWLVWLYMRHRDRVDTTPPGRFGELPRVTVQLPMFNERRVAARVIQAASRLDYPRDRLQIQVLDDSTDESARIARDCCRNLAADGLDIEYLHRENRTGFKAGALAEGMRSATGELITVFDADFVPPPDFLRRTIDQFTDDGVGMVQTRWQHLNRDVSWLTRLQAMSLDAHFIVEQAARAWTGRWFNFNGTAGIWRRQCIEDAGGWHTDTLTEDTDLSYRAQMAGWQFRYLPEVCCEAEIPPTVTAFMCQQHRWNKGLIQSAIKLLPTILRSRVPLKTKIEAWFHLTSPLPYVFIFLLVLLVVPALIVPLPLSGIRTALALWVGISCLALGTLAACVFYIVSQAVQGRGIWRTILRLPALMAVGIGISVINTRAFLEALFGNQSPFVRTPKFAGAERSEVDPLLSLRSRRGLIELAIGVVMLVSVVFAFTRPITLVGVPFLLLFAAGFLVIGIQERLEAAGERR
jgi:cellulose synthase/poly-beta-1,6-N-acetylglucosamine synthase-like glycosyltransferase